MLMDCESCWTHSIPFEDCDGDRCPLCGSSYLLGEQGDEFDSAVWGGGHGRQYAPNKMRTGHEPAAGSGYGGAEARHERGMSLFPPLRELFTRKMVKRGLRRKAGEGHA